MYYAWYSTWTNRRLDAVSLELTKPKRIYPIVVYFDCSLRYSNCVAYGTHHGHSRLVKIRIDVSRDRVSVDEETEIHLAAPVCTTYCVYTLNTNLFVNYTLIMRSHVIKEYFATTREK